LKELDPIACIRYAIVYLGLDNMTSVRDMIDGLLGDQSAAAQAGTSADASAGNVSPALRDTASS
jgi:hypothetical protein